MSIEFKSNFNADKLSKDAMEKHSKDLEKAMAEAAREIIERTRQQKGVNGGAFVRLSEKYKKYKTSKGRRGVPDLTFSGNLLNSIQTKVEKLGKDLIGLIYFSSPKESLKAQGLMKLRKFFALSDKQKEKISKKLEG